MKSKLQNMKLHAGIDYPEMLKVLTERGYAYLGDAATRPAANPNYLYVYSDGRITRGNLEAVFQNHGNPRWYFHKGEFYDSLVIAGTKDTNPKDAIASAKLPLWLLSPIAKAHWAVAQAVGMVKYGAWNWRVAGVRSSIYASAIQRHFDRWQSGEDYDPVDGQSNLGAIMACCAIMLDAEAAGKLTDDRPPSVPVQGTYDQMEAVFKASIERAKAAGMNPTHMTIKDTQ